jgi:hypothetical protein
MFQLAKAQEDSQQIKLNVKKQCQQHLTTMYYHLTEIGRVRKAKAVARIQPEESCKQ